MMHSTTTSAKDSVEDSSLHAVLYRFLAHIGDCRMLVLGTSDGLEVLNVHRDVKNADSRFSDDHAVIQTFASSSTKTFEHVGKLDLGIPQYSLTWTDSGVLVRFKLEALSVTLLMDDSSNLGLLDDHLNSLQRILKPFSTANFVNHHV